MSELLQRHKYFITYITSDKKQGTDLLRKVNKTQAKVISEIFLNFLKGNVDVALTKGIKRKSKLFRLIGSPSVSLSQRQATIQDNPVFVLNFIRLASSQLIDLLS